jgi:pimeloyl-ACP methyl ester carboxylesterase
VVVQPRPVVAAFLAVVSCLGAAAGTGPAVAAELAGSRVRAGADVVAGTRAGSGTLAWKPCEEDKTAQCATLRTPVNWADPYGPKTDIAVARRPATDAKLKVGTLIVNPGGPGGSGVDFALDSESAFGEAVRRRFDIVGFDPRGVSRSTPIKCSAALISAGPSVLINSAKLYDETVAYNRKLGADCAKRTGPVYAHADTLSGIRDMEALRAALGQERISFYGASYGTLLGAQYAEAYPQRVRALALDSVMDHSVGPEQFLADQTVAVQDAFSQFVTWCRAAADCAEHGRDVRGDWAALLARARKGTLTDPFDPARKIDEYALLDVAFGSFYEPQWHSLGIYIREAATGGAGKLSRSAPAEDDGQEFNFPAIFCADWAATSDGWAGMSARLAAMAKADPQMPVSPLGMVGAGACLGRTESATNPQRRLAPSRTGQPVLVINARHDPATPYKWAASVAAQLGKPATLVAYEGAGHGMYGRGDCMNAIVDAYLTTLKVPAAGTSCPAIPPRAGGVGPLAERRVYG